MAGCTGIKVIGSGNLITKAFDFSDFTVIEAENGMHVELTKSGTFGVEVIADDNVMEHIEVSKSGDTLRIRPKANAAFRSATLTAKITMPDLYKLELLAGAVPMVRVLIVYSRLIVFAMLGSLFLFVIVLFFYGG